MRASGAVVGGVVILDAVLTLVELRVVRRAEWDRLRQTGSLVCEVKAGVAEVADVDIQSENGAILDVLRQTVVLVQVEGHVALQADVLVRDVSLAVGDVLRLADDSGKVVARSTDGAVVDVAGVLNAVLNVLRKTHAALQVESRVAAETHVCVRLVACAVGNRLRQTRAVGRQVETVKTGNACVGSSGGDAAVRNVDLHALGSVEEIA